MDEGWRVFERLHKVRHHRVLEQDRHRAVGLEVAREDRRLVAPRTDDDVAEPPLQILEIACQAQDRHHLGGDRDVKAALARKAVRRTAERGGDLAQRPVVHVKHPPPGHPAHVDVEVIAPVDVIVDQRGEQVVGRGDGVKVAGEMEVYVLHRHDLGVAAAGRPALDAEIGAERGLAQADGRLLADGRQPVAEPHRGRRLALTRRRRTDRRYQDQLAVGPVGEAFDEIGRDLRLVVAVRQEMFAGNAEPVADLPDRLLARGARDLDVAPEFSHVKASPKAIVSGKP